MKTTFPKNLLKIIFVGVGFTLAGVGLSHGAIINAWINEIHYDNNGSDVGGFIEVVVPTSVSDLNNVLVTFYNGADGATYNPGGGSYRMLSTFSMGTSANGFTVYSLSGIDMQNGPDGFVLSYGGTLLQFLSYSGSFTGSAGIASGVTSVDIGVQESSSTLVGASLGLTGTGSQYSDFTWATFSDDTPGSFNLGEAVVPEPAAWGTVSGFGLLGICGFKAWREHRQKRRAGIVK